MGNASRDDNYVTTLMGVDFTDLKTPVLFSMDAATNRLRVTATLPSQPDTAGTWGYHAGTSGAVTMSGSKRVLRITAIALGAAGSLTIDAGDTITIPYDSTDKASSSITIEPIANLTDPAIIFTGTDAYMIEYVV